jgi:tubulin-folding cofactor B
MVLISLFLSSPDTHSERRLESSLTVQQLKVSSIHPMLRCTNVDKDKLTPITGIQPQYQRLQLFPSTEAKEPIANLNDDTRTLESYGIAEWQHIKVDLGSESYSGLTDSEQVDNLDPNARPGEFSDLTGVEKFELSNEEYESRSGRSQRPVRYSCSADVVTDTVLAHLKANKLGRFAPVPQTIAHAPPPLPPSSSITPGARCEVITGEGGLEKRGTVRFVGEASMGKAGIWVGVELDEPVGKGDGS